MRLATPVVSSPASLAHHAVIVPVINVRIGDMAPVHRGDTVRAGFRAGDAAIAVVVVEDKRQRSLWPGIAVLHDHVRRGAHRIYALGRILRRSCGR